MVLMVDNWRETLRVVVGETCLVVFGWNRIRQDEEEGKYEGKVEGVEGHLLEIYQ